MRRQRTPRSAISTNPDAAAARAVVTGLALVCLLAWGAGFGHGQDQITVQVGAGHDTTVVSAFLPERVRIAVGDTVTFRLTGDGDAHTVTFLGGTRAPSFVQPAGDGSGRMLFNPVWVFPTRDEGAAVETYDGTALVTSGWLSDGFLGRTFPVIDQMSLTFMEPGTYDYECLLHPFMTGTIVVDDAAAGGFLSHDEIDAAADAEAAVLLALTEVLRENERAPIASPGLDDTTMWSMLAGANAPHRPRAAVFEFFPRRLTVTAGDRVTWTSHEFHTVTFSPVPPGPEAFVADPAEQGGRVILINPLVSQAVKPTEVYDPSEYYNSGFIGPGLPNGQGFSLVFEEPGTYDYSCTLHGPKGMEGTITVLPRDP
jgi:plastocyanin